MDRALSIFPTTAESHEPAKLPASSLGMHPRPPTPARARPLPAPRQGRNLPVETASGPPTTGGRPHFFFNAIKFNIYKNNPIFGAKMTGHTMCGLEGVPGLPGAPQDEAGLTRKFDPRGVRITRCGPGSLAQRRCKVKVEVCAMMTHRPVHRGETRGP